MKFKTYMLLTAGHLFPVELIFWYISHYHSDISASLEYINFAYFSLVLLHGIYFVYEKYGAKMERLFALADCIFVPAKQNRELPDWERELNG